MELRIDPAAFAHLQQQLQGNNVYVREAEANLMAQKLSNTYNHPVQAVVRKTFPHPDLGTIYEFPALGIEIQTLHSTVSNYINIGITNGDNWESIDITSSEFTDLLTLLNYLKETHG
jgi:hypothetical protein